MAKAQRRQHRHVRRGGAPAEPVGRGAQARPAQVHGQSPAGPPRSSSCDSQAAPPRRAQASRSRRPAARSTSQRSSAVDALEAAVSAALAAAAAEPRGTIRLTAPPDLGRMLLAPMFVAFLERYRDISLDLIYTNRYVDLVQEGVDLAVRAGRMPKSDLIARRLCDLRAALRRRARPPTSRLADIRTLSAQPFVLYRASGGTQTLRIERLQRQAPPEPRAERVGPRQCRRLRRARRAGRRRAGRGAHAQPARARGRAHRTPRARLPRVVLPPVAGAPGVSVAPAARARASARRSFCCASSPSALSSRSGRESRPEAARLWLRFALAIS